MRSLLSPWVVGLFAYRLVSGHWRLQTGVSRIGEEGSVTTAGVLELNVLTGWDQRRPEWADVAWLAMRVLVGRQRKMGVADVIDVEEQDEPPTRKRKGRPQRGHGASPPTKPRVRPPWQSGRCRAELVVGRGQRGVVHEWVEQQWAGAWEARAISAEAANRDLEARLPRANCDRRDAESRSADVTKERDRLAASVKTVECNLATSRKAKPPAQAAQAGEKPEGAEAALSDRGGGRCRRCPVPPGQRTGVARPGRGVRGQMSAVSSGLRMAMMASGQQADVDSVAPDTQKVSASLEEVRQQYPPSAPRRPPWTPPLWRWLWGQTSQCSASRSSAPGGWCVAHTLTFGPPVPSNLHECYPAPPPPQAWAV